MRFTIQEHCVAKVAVEDEYEIQAFRFPRTQNVSDEKHDVDDKTNHDVKEAEHDIHDSGALSSKSGRGGSV